MKYTVHKMSIIDTDEYGKKYNLYAFIDNHGHTIVQVYGEKARDWWVKRFNSYGG